MLLIRLMFGAQLQLSKGLAMALVEVLNVLFLHFFYFFYLVYATVVLLVCPTVPSAQAMCDP